MRHLASDLKRRISFIRHRTGLAAAAVALLVVATVATGVGSAGAAPAAPRYNLYYGDLHQHTAYSDGWTGTPWDAFAAAKAAGADFMATTDHDSYGFWISPEEWADTLAAAEFHTNRSFVAMAGYEMWIAGAGEINIFNTREFPPVPRDPDQRPVPGNADQAFEVLAAVYDWLADQPGAVGQWNHPTYVSHNFFGFDLWSSHRDIGMGIIEVWNDSWFYTEDSYVLALDAGWHVMPSANADTHNPDWISGSNLRTVLLAPRLTPDDLYAAMRAGRGYATVDKNLRIDYTLNGQPMGSILAPAASYTASIRVEDPDGLPISAVEIVTDGGQVAARLDTAAPVVEWTTTLTSTTARYYYVKVRSDSIVSSVQTRQTGGAGVAAVTAPVWTGR